MLEPTEKLGGVREFDAPRPNVANPSESPIRLWTPSELLRLPEPSWLVRGVLPEQALCGIVGETQSGKTYLALAWSLCIATGTPWLGRPVRTGTVVYIVGEGFGLFVRRIAAWCNEHDIPSLACLDGKLHIVREPVQFLDAGQLESLIGTVTPHRPDLTVVDTLACASVGADENSAQHMGLFVHACKQVRTATDGSVLVVHHTGRGSTTPRGSSSFDGALDAYVKITNTKARVQVTHGKQKDHEPLEPISLQLKSVTLPPAEDGSERTSCVLVAGRDATKARSLRPGVTNKDEDVLVALHEIGATEPVTAARLASHLGVDRSAPHRALERLEKGGYIKNVGTARRKAVQLTGPGMDLVAELVAAGCTPPRATTATPGCSLQPPGSLKEPRSATTAGQTRERDGIEQRDRAVTHA